jgi:hypothetical protein
MAGVALNREPPAGINFEGVSDSPPAAQMVGNLLTLMQDRMPYFTSRGMTSIWQSVASGWSMARYAAPQATDVAAVADWVKAIDDWYSATENHGE